MGRPPRAGAGPGRDAVIVERDLSCIRCGHGPGDHERTPTFMIGKCCACLCDKYGLTQCLDCGKFLGRYLVLPRCDSCYAWWDRSGQATVYYRELGVLRRAERIAKEKQGNWRPIWKLPKDPERLLTHRFGALSIDKPLIRDERLTLADQLSGGDDPADLLIQKESRREISRLLGRLTMRQIKRLDPARLAALQERLAAYR